MIKAAVFNDNVRELPLLEEALLECGEHTGGLQISTFETPGDLRKAVSSGEAFSLFALGFAAPCPERDACVRDLRARGIPGILVVSGGAYEPPEDPVVLRVNRPLSRDALKSAVNAALNIGLPGESRLLIFTPRGEEAVPLGEIVYAEVAGHTLCFHLRGGRHIRSKVLRIPFRQAAAPLFRDERFLMPHRSYLVNAAFVSDVSRTGLTLRNGVNLPVSRLRYDEVQSALSRYRES